MTTLDQQTIITAGNSHKVHGAVNNIYALLSIGQSAKDAINAIMTKHFGSDAQGYWTRRMAYDVCETALTKFIHTYGRVILDTAKATTVKFLSCWAKWKL